MPVFRVPNRHVCDKDLRRKSYWQALGKTKSSTHCPDCEARAGKVKTIAEWRALGKPKCKCKCRLVPQ